MSAHQKLLYVTIATLTPLLSALAETQPLFDSPKKLSAVEAPIPSGTPLKKVEKYSGEGGLVTVTLLVYPPITHLESAQNFVSENISGMKNNGFELARVTTTQVGGFEARKVEGTYTSPSYEGVFNTTNLTIFASDSVYSLVLSVHDSGEFAFSIEELFERLTIAGEPLALDAGPAPPLKAFQTGEKFGEIFFYAILVAAIVLIVKRVSRKKSPEEELPPQDNG